MVSRRTFVAAGIAALPGMVGLPRWLFAEDEATPLLPFEGNAASRELAFTHSHTGERLAVEYFTAGSYQPEAMVEVNQFLRDFRTEEVHPIDPGVLDILHALRIMTGGSRPFQVISGYRSPATNAMLRRLSGGVAGNSLHMEGKAIDIRLPGVSLRRVRDAALKLKRGGVGYYPASRFVHVDTGRVRRW
ncbi:MAG TPA: DUF882 domain-containing protein [Gemmatimonadales bacterium]